LDFACARVDRDRGNGFDQFALQNRPASRRRARDHGGGASLDFLFAGDDFGLRGDGGFHRSRAIWPYAALAAVALFGAFVALMHGLALGPASVLVPVAQMSFLPTALLGAIIFRERLDGKKYAGLAIAVAALVLFAAS
jgi:drug/metabolite transporter (DMT)-like permease